MNSALRKQLKPVFVTKMELVLHYGCDINSINHWIRAGTIPPPHSRPGPRYPIWLREHFDEMVRTGRWPQAAYPKLAPA
jgi:hypothetical protein